MDKEIKKIIKKAEELDWVITDEGNNQYLFSKYSPAGQDFNITVEGRNAEELIHDIYERYDNFDVSYETYLWLDSTGHGTNGAPYDMRDLYEDMESCQDMILELYNKLIEL